MQIAKPDHIGLHWREDGNASGRAVMFANSLGTDVRLWDLVVPLLPQHLRYIRYAKRGHCLSDCPTAPYAMDDADTWSQRVAAIEDGGIETLADPISKRWFSAACRAISELAAWRNMLIRTPVERYPSCCHAIAESEDQARNPDLVKATADVISGAKFNLIEGAGHLPSFEKPEVFAALRAQFFEETEYV